MKGENKKMPSVITEIIQWVNTLPYWEQAALDKILNGVQFTESDYDELLQYLLKDNGLIEPNGQRPQLHFIDNSFPHFTNGQIVLLKLFNLQNINALVSEQSLTFSPELTVIFGANASGKSGYARVLGCAGFTRGDKDVLPNVRKSTSPSTIMCADIEINDGTSNKVINYQIGRRCPELESFYVFDSTSVYVHLTESNTFSFTPAGLSYLTQLVEITDNVRKHLNSVIKEYKKDHDFGFLFQGESAITKLIVDLGPETDLTELNNLATLRQEEKKQIEELDLKIAELKTQDIPKQINELRELICFLEQLNDSLFETKKNLNDDTIKDIVQNVNLYNDRESEAQLKGVNQFRSEHFTQIGSDTWHRFILAAKALAEEEENSDNPYPQADNHCLLCQQPLSTEAHDLLHRLWIFIKGEAQAKLDVIQKILDKKHKELKNINLDFFDNQSITYIYLKEKKIDLVKQILAFIKICRIRRAISLKNIEDHSIEAVPKLPDNGISKIEEIIKELEIECNKLVNDNPAQKIIELEQQILYLQHRKILGENLRQIETYVHNQVWAQNATNIGGSTRHITLKYNDIFGQLVSNRYIEIFEQTLQDLQRPLSVKINTLGRKGETYKKIVLETDSDSIIEDISPGEVLSEGEKRAVALADFLTEVALDTSSSGIILDDPVTSLDFEWKDKISSILADEAKSKQVIIFTHDLPFLYFLTKYAKQKNVKLATHWIKRGDNDNQPGYVFLDNSPALERDFRTSKRAHEIYQQAMNAQATEQENLLRQGFGALRTVYEAFIIFDLFNEVVKRFDERISFGRLNDIVWDDSIVEEVIDRCENLSIYIEGHLHTDTFAKKPTCELLMKEIETFDGIKKKLKKIKNV